MVRNLTVTSLRVLATCMLVTTLAGCATSPTPRSNLAALSALQQQADGAYARQDWSNAARAYLALTNRVPDNAAYWFRLGNSYARLGNLNAAADAYHGALQRDPHIAPAWHNLGSVLLQQSQAAFGEAAANADTRDSLKRASTLMQKRIKTIREGTPSNLPSGSAPQAATTNGAMPAAAATSKTNAEGGRQGR